MAHSGQFCYFGNAYIGAGWAANAYANVADAASDGSHLTAVTILRGARKSLLWSGGLFHEIDYWPRVRPHYLRHAADPTPRGDFHRRERMSAIRTWIARCL